MKNKGLKLLLLTAALLFTGCGNTSSSSSEVSEPSSSEVSSESSSESSSETTYENEVSIADAIDLASDAGETGTTTKYVVRGTVKSITNTTYGNMFITDGTNELQIYGSYSEDGSTRFDKMSVKPKVGDTIVIKGVLKTYNSSPEMVDGWILEIVSNSEGGDNTDSNLPTSGEVTIAQALQISLKAGETPTTGKYILKGTIKNITNSQFGNMYITDGKDEILIYGLYDGEGNRYDAMDSTPTTGDEITVEGSLMAFKGDTPQMKDATLKEVKVSFDPSQYTQKTVTEARSAEKGDKVKVKGVVASITYATGMVPNGFYVVDNGASIYVYGKDVAGVVKVGNTVTVAGTKDYYVLETESSAASQWGYKGSNQLANARVIENDNSTTGAWDKSWVSETTVKAMMETSFAEDVTTKIYKVTALINKVDGKGFTNYYINDLDGYTGTYSYSQASGEDYSWLDEFDGKICTVYVASHNAKAAVKGCNWRFVPIACEEATNFEFDMSTAPKFAYDYYLDGQLEGSYYENRDAKLELINKVENKVVNFDATVTYASSNAEVATIETVDGKTILHTAGKGTTKITITVAVAGQTSYSKEVEMEVKEIPSFNATTVENAIKAEAGEEVTLHGVVVSSIVNQSGFYLQDETGIITVIGPEDMVSNLSVGDEIVVKGTRGNKMKSGVSAPGQICLLDSEIIINFHGNNSYSTEKFITGKTLADLYKLDGDNDIHSTEVYIVTATVVVEETDFFTKIVLQDNDTTFELYCSGAGQYSFLKPYAGQEVTLEINPCNYNKTFYKGCVISVTGSDGVKVINTLNFSA